MNVTRNWIEKQNHSELIDIIYLLSFNFFSAFKYLEIFRRRYREDRFNKNFKIVKTIRNKELIFCIFILYIFPIFLRFKNILTNEKERNDIKTKRTPVKKARIHRRRRVQPRQKLSRSRKRHACWLLSIRTTSPLLEFYISYPICSN